MEDQCPGGIITFHPKLLEHDGLTAGPEGGRLTGIIEALTQEGLWGEQVFEADIAPMKRLRDVHDPEYLNDLHRRSQYGADQLDANTPLMGQSFEIARFGAGGVLDAIDQIMEGRVTTAFCLTAMPGHHAGFKSFGHGSLINPLAAGAHYLTKKYGLTRVAIVDLDAEHGSGTQEIFWRRRDVLTVSLHEYPGKTGTGHYSEVGEKASQGFNLNIPLPSAYGDRELRVCFSEILHRIFDQYQPEFYLIGFGTNVLAEDPSSHLIVSEHGLLHQVADILALARKHAGGRLVSVLEGGSPGKLMGRVVSQHSMLVVNNRMAEVDRGKKDELISYSDWFRYSRLLKAQFRKFWKL
jgi:acetoin utilization deacetylase AcuC-like enzyme